MINAISVDLEEWYHICGIDSASAQREWREYGTRLDKSVNKLLCLFKTHGIRATFFTVGIIADSFLFPVDCQCASIPISIYSM